MIAIRPATTKDAGAIAAIYAPHVVAGEATFETRAPDAAEIRRRMAHAGDLYPWLVAVEEDGGGVLGYAYAARFRERVAYRWVVETTIYVADVAQKQGVGRLLYGALVQTLRAQGFGQAIGVIALPNDGSIALHEAVGFRRAGVTREVGFKNGRWIDVGWWQCALASLPSPPAEPRPFAEVGVRRS